VVGQRPPRADGRRDRGPDGARPGLLRQRPRVAPRPHRARRRTPFRPSSRKTVSTGSPTTTLVLDAAAGKRRVEWEWTGRRAGGCKS
jgi:hypothetical protein